MNNQDCCIKEILQIIRTLQDEAGQIDNIPNSCGRPFLGNICTDACCFNTRPVTLYTCNCQLLSMPYTLNGTDSTSSVFRVEKINDNCATFMVLAPNTDETSDLPYVPTNSFFTVNIDCICIIRCLPDTFVSCL